jgi:hypothetical protein
MCALREGVAAGGPLHIHVGFDERCSGYPADLGGWHDLAGMHLTDRVFRNAAARSAGREQQQCRADAYYLVEILHALVLLKSVHD